MASGGERAGGGERFCLAFEVRMHGNDNEIQRGEVRDEIHWYIEIEIIITSKRKYRSEE